MKPRSKSVWMTPAAWGALAPRFTVQARHSSSPAVRKVMRSRILYAVRATASRPGSLRPRLSRNAGRSALSSPAISASAAAQMTTTSAPLDVDDVVVLEAPHHVRDRVGLADVGEELISETLALGGAADQAGDVDEVHGGGDDRLRMVERDQRVEPRVGHRHHADVRL